MRWVEQAAIRPHRCAVLPFIGNSGTRKGFIDTGSEMDGFDNHVYISVEAVEEMARMLGWQPPSVARDLEARIASLEAQLEEAREQAEAAGAFIDAIDVIESADFRARRKPGRKPKEVAA